MSFLIVGFFCVGGRVTEESCGFGRFECSAACGVAWVRSSVVGVPGSCIFSVCWVVVMLFLSDSEMSFSCPGVVGIVFLVVFVVAHGRVRFLVAIV